MAELTGATGAIEAMAWFNNRCARTVTSKAADGELVPLALVSVAVRRACRYWHYSP